MLQNFLQMDVNFKYGGQHVVLYLISKRVEGLAEAFIRHPSLKGKARGLALHEMLRYLPRYLPYAIESGANVNAKNGDGNMHPVTCGLQH